MPEFNFAGADDRDEPSEPRDDGADASGKPPQRRRTISDTLPDDLAAGPARSDSTRAMRRALEREPQRTPPPPPAAHAAPPPPPPSVEPLSPPAAPQSGRGTLVAFAVVVGILLILSFLWYWEPFPSVKRALERVLGEGAHPHPVATTADTGRAAPPAAASASGDWEYFVQISSWKAQYLAQDQANGFRSAGVPVVVDLAYVARQRAPRFRVRLGPYPTRAAALRVKDSLGPRIDRGSFVDSVSLSGPAPGGRPPDHRPPAPQPVERPRRESHAGGIRVVTTPRSGYGVQVSSFGSEKTARDEAARLLDRGFPAFVTLAVLPGSSWYRVCVGPFDTREEAQRYRSLFQETAGNEALIVDFGTR